MTDVPKRNFQLISKTRAGRTPELNQEIKLMEIYVELEHAGFDETQANLVVDIIKPHITTQPEVLKALQEIHDKACAVSAGEEWTMNIPPNPEDPDVYICDRVLEILKRLEPTQ